MSDEQINEFKGYEGLYIDQINSPEEQVRIKAKIDEARLEGLEVIVTSCVLDHREDPEVIVDSQIQTEGGEKSIAFFVKKDEMEGAGDGEKPADILYVWGIKK